MHYSIRCCVFHLATITLALWAAVFSSPLMADINTDITLQARVFDKQPESVTKAKKDHADTSIALRLEGRKSLNPALDFKYEAVYKATPSARQHFNVASLFVSYYAETWDLRFGYDTVFWGVMESNHVVDYVNQSNYLESFHTEDKLGQPMIALRTLSDSMVFQAFALIGTQEREFLSPHERLSGNIHVDDANSEFESSHKDKRVDTAIRISQTIDIFDYAVSYFYGSQRNPDLILQPNSAIFIPYYPLTQRLGVEFQVTLDHIMYKLEAIHEHSDHHHYNAGSVGFEYTQGSILQSNKDLGYLLEYSFDNRDNPSLTPFQHDIFGGLRLALNDTASSEFIVGVTHDLDNHSQVIRLQFESRLNPSLSIDLDSWIFVDIAEEDIFYRYKDDSYLEVNLRYYF
jgi:hypothetical protein